jgi:phage tail-like protein
MSITLSRRTTTVTALVVLAALAALTTLIAVRDSASATSHSVTFATIQGIGEITEVIEYRDGEDQILRKRPGRTSYSTITLRASFTESAELRSWWEAITAGQEDGRTVEIILTNTDGTAVGTFTLLGAWPCAWRGADGNFASLETGMSEVDICYDELIRS